ncbi:hypothetical protein H9P43_006528 [Blastocladiella emersonii ATCC 22665]|nr:hypothetical protein H9P43_006528 [Blastocladiella emersonii ATCC 22665]
MKLDATEPSDAPARDLPAELWELVVGHVFDRASSDPADPWRWDLLHLGNLCRTTYAVTRPYLIRELVLGFRADATKNTLPAWDRTVGVHPLSNLRTVPELYPLVVRGGKLFLVSAAADGGGSLERITGGLVLIPFPLSLVSALSIIDYNDESFDLRETVGGRKWSRLPFLAELDPNSIRKLEVRSMSKSVRDFDYEQDTLDFGMPAINSLVLSKRQIKRMRELGLDHLVGNSYPPYGMGERTSDASADDLVGSDSDANTPGLEYRLFSGVPRHRAFRRLRSLTLRSRFIRFDSLNLTFTHPHLERLALIGPPKSSAGILPATSVLMPSLRHLELTFSIISRMRALQSDILVTGTSFPVLETLTIIDDCTAARNQYTGEAPHLNLRDWPAFPTLRELHVLPEYRGHRAQAALMPLDLAHLSRKSSKLERLMLPTVSVRTGFAGADAVRFPCLRELDATASLCQVLGRTALPNLRKLTVRGSLEAVPGKLWPNLEVVEVEAQSVGESVRAITRELLLRRAEHNNGDLDTLREITLHQFDLEKIELLDVYCRKLRIVYLQNNQITKIENLGKLKELEYLNLALNNITVIENLDSCESLAKLDLTVNFIDDLFCVQSLISCRHLRELYLTGNPVTGKPGYREFVICTLDQLDRLDGVAITRSERLRARQTFEAIRDAAATLPVHVPAIPDPAELDLLVDGDDAASPEAVAAQFQTAPTEHTPAARMAAARHLAKLRDAKDPEKRAAAEREARRAARAAAKPSRVAADGTLMQCNEPKLEYTLHEHAEIVVLDLRVSKFIDTSLLDVAVFPDTVRVTVAGQRVQLRTPAKVDPERYLPVRSMATGALLVHMVRAEVDGVRTADEVVGAWRDAERRQAKDAERARAEKAKREREATLAKLAALKVGGGGGATWNEPTAAAPEIRTARVGGLVSTSGAVGEEEWEDDADVPPLV